MKKGLWILAVITLIAGCKKKDGGLQSNSAKQYDVTGYIDPGTYTGSSCTIYFYYNGKYSTHIAPTNWDTIMTGFSGDSMRLSVSPSNNPAVDPSAIIKINLHGDSHVTTIPQINGWAKYTLP